MNKKGVNNHHRIAKSRACDGYNVHHPDNQGLMNKKKHEAVHALFENLVPHEQFDELLRINKQVMNDHVIKLIKRAIHDPNFYLEHLYTDGYNKNRRNKGKKDR